MKKSLSIFFFSSLSLFQNLDPPTPERKTLVECFPRDISLLSQLFLCLSFSFLEEMIVKKSRGRSALSQLLPLSSPSLLLFFLLLAATTATTTNATWRPTPLRASAPAISLSSSGSLSIRLKYKTWDGNFLDVVELPAGEFCDFIFLFFFRFGQALNFFHFSIFGKSTLSLSLNLVPFLSRST